MYSTGVLSVVSLELVTERKQNCKKRKPQTFVVYTVERRRHEKSLQVKSSLWNEECGCL